MAHAVLLAWLAKKLSLTLTQWNLIRCPLAYHSCVWCFESICLINFYEIKHCFTGCIMCSKYVHDEKGGLSICFGENKKLNPIGLIRFTFTHSKGLSTSMFPWQAGRYQGSGLWAAGMGGAGVCSLPTRQCCCLPGGPARTKCGPWTCLPLAQCC